MNINEAIDTIQQYCDSIKSCENCKLYWVCGYNKPQLFPPCTWNTETIKNGGRDVIQKQYERDV